VRPNGHFGAEYLLGDGGGVEGGVDRGRASQLRQTMSKCGNHLVPIPILL
jgi:hypothetical protein